MSKSIWGILFIFVGLGMAGKAVGLFDFNVFFPGWWTMFIIVPSAVGLTNPNNRTSSIIGLFIGLLLFFFSRGYFSWYSISRLFIPFILIAIGIHIIQKGFNYKRDTEYYKHTNSYKSNIDTSQNASSNHNTYNDQTSSNYSSNNDRTSSNYSSNSDQSSSNYSSNNDESSSNYSSNNDQSSSNYSSNNDQSSNNYNNNSAQSTSGFNNKNNQSTNGPNFTYSNTNQSSSYRSTNHGGNREFNGILSGRNIQFVDEVFHGAFINSILGNVQLDLRNAIFEKDTVIDVTCILGGIDVYVPSNVKVAVNCTPILAGVDNVVITPIDVDQNTYTIFINGTCILGGIEVK
jgi:hypothetical protein